MRTITLTRDDLAKVLFYEDFFERNPAFAPIQQAITDCKTAYQESAKKSSCRCGGSSRLLFGCLDATIQLMETLRTENPEALTTLLGYLSDKRNQAGITAFTLYYRKTSKDPLLKAKFP